MELHWYIVFILQVDISRVIAKVFLLKSVKSDYHNISLFFCFADWDTTWRRGYSMISGHCEVCSPCLMPGCNGHDAARTHILRPRLCAFAREPSRGAREWYVTLGKFWSMDGSAIADKSAHFTGGQPQPWRVTDHGSPRHAMPWATTTLLATKVKKSPWGQRPSCGGFCWECEISAA